MTNNLSVLPRATYLAALGALILSKSVSLAATLSFEASVANTALDWPIIFDAPNPPALDMGKPLQLAKFNPLLGHLDSVKFEVVEFDTTTKLAVQNLSNNPRTFGFSISTLLNLYQAFGTPAVPVEPAIVSVAAATAPITFALNPQNTAGSTFGPTDLLAGLAAPVVQNYSGDAAVAPFIASGPTDALHFEAGTESSAITSFPDNTANSYSSGGSLRIRITYSYTLPPPDENPPSANCVTVNAVKGVPLQPVTMVATGGCATSTGYTFSATGLPAGLSMSSGGTISGTPTVGGTFAYTVTVSDSCGNQSTIHCSLDVDCTPTGTATIGYWKNHPEAWPVSSITIGSVTYTKAQAIAILGGTGSNASLLLAKQLIAAKLSAQPSLCNDSSCVTIDIVRADQLLALYPVGNNAPTASRNEILAIKTKLDDYNNGRLCEAHRN